VTGHASIIPDGPSGSHATVGITPRNGRQDPHNCLAIVASAPNRDTNCQEVATIMAPMPVGFDA